MEKDQEREKKLTRDSSSDAVNYVCIVYTLHLLIIFGWRRRSKRRRTKGSPFQPHIHRLTIHPLAFLEELLSQAEKGTMVFRRYNHADFICGTLCKNHLVRWSEDYLIRWQEERDMNTQDQGSHVFTKEFTYTWQYQRKIPWVSIPS